MKTWNKERKRTRDRLLNQQLKNTSPLPISTSSCPPEPYIQKEEIQNNPSIDN